MTRIRGKIRSWNDDKGYGFIVSEHGSRDCFVHISAFGNIPRRPRIGDVVDFQIAESSDGKQKAVSARIAEPNGSLQCGPRFAPKPRQQALESLRVPLPRGRHRRWLRGSAFAVPFALGAAMYGYETFQSGAIFPGIANPAPLASDRIDRPRFRCAGKIYCREMTSCEEARFYLQHCPGTKMDGDHDGIPCESQWCGG